MEVRWVKLKETKPGKGQLVLLDWAKDPESWKVGYRYNGPLEDVDGYEWVIDSESWMGSDPDFWLPLPYIHEPL